VGVELPEERGGGRRFVSEAFVKEGEGALVFTFF